MNKGRVAAVVALALLLVVLLGLCGWLACGLLTDVFPASTIAVAPSATSQPARTDAQSPHDDLLTDDAIRQAAFAARVNEVVDEATTVNSGKLTADERALPVPALLLLKQSIDPGLPQAASDALASVLAGDTRRLRLALARQKENEWYLATTLRIFDANTPTDARWRAPARLAILAAVRTWEADPQATGDEPTIAYRESASAIRAGCRDPLVFYVRAWCAKLQGLGWGDVPQAARTAAAKIEQSEYPAIRKMMAVLLEAESVAQERQDPANDPEIKRLLDRANALFPQVLADPALPRSQVISLFESMAQTSVAVYGDRRTLPLSFYDQLEKSSVDRSTVLTAFAQFQLEFDRDEHTAGWPYKLGQGELTALPENLAKAAPALEEAWKLDPTNAFAAVLMQRVVREQARGRDQVDLWFNRAIEADPQSFAACMAKLTSLEPPSGGSVDEMIAFAKECVARGAWDTKIPLLLIRAHLAASQYTEGDPGVLQTGWIRWLHPQYFHDSPDAWNDVKSTYDEYFRHFPKCDVEHLQYARIAVWTEHWADADEQFHYLGDTYDARIYEYRPSQTGDRSLVARHVAAPASRP